MTNQKTLSASDPLILDVVCSMHAGVERFNTQVRGVVLPPSPRVLTEAEAQRAQDAVDEEMGELIKASREGNVAEAADAIIDAVYFLLGRLTEMGVPAKAVFDAVQKANMAKIPGDLDKRKGWGGTDAIKPEGWKAPDHSWLLSFSLADLGYARAITELSPVFQEITALRAAKGADYNNVPGGRDAYFPFGHQSYAHMMHTKGLRLMSLVKSMSEGREPNFEGIRDTVRDLVNYGAFYCEWMDRQAEVKVAA
jgi:phosphoribosyl-ATP pyrophosphohydrolase